jgi:DNA polymerase-3 subunit delta
VTGTQHAFDFLELTSPIPAAVAVFGDETFLKRLVRTRLVATVVGDDPSAIYATFDGASVEWRDVSDELATLTLFGNNRRLVVVAEADDFVSRFRAQLEQYVAQPRRTGVLVLEVGTWASNTRLYKAIHQAGLQVDCRLPQRTAGRSTVVDETRLLKWLVAWSKSQHGAELDASAARLLWELAGPDLGMVDQDVAKLALFAPSSGKIGAKLVQEVVGGWRGKTVWETIDAAADGNANEALRQLDKALQSGEHPQALFGQISWSLRRYAVAARIYQQAEAAGQRLTLREALVEAGFRTWPADALAVAERQLIQIGRDRAGKLFSWLLDADLAMKGSHSAPERARFTLELLFLRLAKRTASRSTGRRVQPMGN